MKAYQISGASGLSSLLQVEIDEPGSPGSSEVLVEMRAFSLNSRDLAMLHGGYPGNTKVVDDPPLIPLSDGAGEVIAVGHGVSEFAVGDMVCPTFFANWTSGQLSAEGIASARGGAIDGVLRDRLLVDAKGLVKAPSHLSFEQAATLPCAALTAWHALSQAKPKAKKSVLLLGTGGVSTFALAFAERLGLEIILTSSSDEKLESASEIAEFQSINYRNTPEWAERVRELTDGRGVDIVVEVGGRGTLARSIDACAVGGNIALIGVLEAGDSNPSPMPLLFKNICLQGIYVGSREMFEQMNDFISKEKLYPQIHKEFNFNSAAEAYSCLQSGEHQGKIVLRG